MTKKEVIIIPNENILNVPIDNKPVNQYHGENIKNFSDEHNLGLTFESLGLRENEYFGNYWQLAIAKLGHVVITIEDSVLVFLPKTISNGQLNWFLVNREYFVKKRNFFEYQFVDIPIDSEYIELSGNKKIKKFYRLLKAKNILEKERLNEEKNKRNL